MPGVDAAFMFEKRTENTILRLGERNVFSFDGNGLFVQIDHQSLILQRMRHLNGLLGGRSIGAAQNGTDAKEHLTDGEGLGDIIVGTEVKTGN